MKNWVEQVKLTKHSQRNLDVIENFILHITHCSNESDEEFTTPQSYTPEELYNLAYEYILEDHVDGEESEEADNERYQESINKNSQNLTK